MPLGNNMTITLTPGHILVLLSGIVFGTTLVFNAAYYLGRFMGRLQRVEEDVVKIQKEVTELRIGV